MSTSRRKSSSSSSKKGKRRSTNSSDGKPMTAVEKQREKRRRGEFADFVFTLGGKEFPVHRADLASASRNFVERFSSYPGFEEGRSGMKVPVMADISPRNFDLFLDHVYTQEDPVTMGNAADLMRAAHYYQVKSLLRFVDAHVASFLGASEAAGWYLDCCMYEYLGDEKKSTVLQKTKTRAYELLLTEFPTMLTNDDRFVELPAHILHQLLSSDKLNTGINENFAINGLITWYLHDTTTRKVALTGDVRRSWRPVTGVPLLPDDDKTPDAPPPPTARRFKELEGSAGLMADIRWQYASIQMLRTVLVNDKLPSRFYDNDRTWMNGGTLLSLALFDAMAGKIRNVVDWGARDCYQGSCQCGRDFQPLFCPVGGEDYVMELESKHTHHCDSNGTVHRNGSSGMKCVTWENYNPPLVPYCSLCGKFKQGYDLVGKTVTLKEQVHDGREYIKSGTKVKVIDCNGSSVAFSSGGKPFWVKRSQVW